MLPSPFSVTAPRVDKQRLSPDRPFHQFRQLTLRMSWLFLWTGKVCWAESECPAPCNYERPTTCDCRISMTVLWFGWDLRQLLCLDSETLISVLRLESVLILCAVEVPAWVRCLGTRGSTWSVGSL